MTLAQMLKPETDEAEARVAYKERLARIISDELTRQIKFGQGLEHARRYNRFWK